MGPIAQIPNALELPKKDKIIPKLGIEIAKIITRIISSGRIASLIVRFNGDGGGSIGVF